MLYIGSMANQLSNGGVVSKSNQDFSGEQSPPHQQQPDSVHPEAIEQGGKTQDRNKRAAEDQKKPEDGKG
jgi:hypothetical protein